MPPQALIFSAIESAQSFVYQHEPFALGCHELLLILKRTAGDQFPVEELRQTTPSFSLIFDIPIRLHIVAVAAPRIPLGPGSAVSRRNSPVPTTFVSAPIAAPVSVCAGPRAHAEHRPGLPGLPAATAQLARQRRFRFRRLLPPLWPYASPCRSVARFDQRQRNGSRSVSITSAWRRPSRAGGRGVDLRSHPARASCSSSTKRMSTAGRP